MSGDDSPGGEEHECPECGNRLYHHSPGVPTLFCDTCEREYWREGGNWFSCDETGVPVRV